MSDNPYRPYNPDKEEHQKLGQSFLDAIDMEQPAETSTLKGVLVEQYGPGTDMDYSKNHIINLITGMRKYYIDEGKIKTRKKRNGGIPTIIYKRA